jgi:hypothetical protein
MPQDKVEYFKSTLGVLVREMQLLAAPEVPDRLMAKRYGPFHNGEPFDPGIRIVIMDLNDVGSPERRLKAVFWFVSDFLDTTPTDFEAKAMETEDRGLIDLLEKLITYYENHGDDVPPLPATTQHAPVAPNQTVPVANPRTPDSGT